VPELNEDFSLDDIKIHSAEVVDKPVPASPYIRPAEIIVDAVAWNQMNQHAREDLRYEAGGVMLGGIYEHDGGLVVRITTAVAAREAVNSVASIQFTYDAWSQMEKERQQRAPAEKLVGWYHTHPGFSAFFSSTDHFMHENFFTQPWHIALVIDPINSEHRFYRWDGGRVQEVAEFLLQVTQWPGPQPSVQTVLSASLRQAAQQLEQEKDGASNLAPALHRLVGSLHGGLSARPLQELLPFIVACSELAPEALAEARRKTQESHPPDSAIRFKELEAAGNNRNPEGAISIAYGWLAQQVDRRHLHLHGLDESQRYCQEIALPFVIHDLTIGETGHVLTLSHGQDSPLHRLEPALPLFRSSAHAAGRSHQPEPLTPFEIDWQGRKPERKIGKILAGRQQIYLLTKSELLVLANAGPANPLRLACTGLHEAAACGWESFFDLTSWTVDPTGNLYLLGGAEGKEVWKLDRLADRWTLFLRDHELDRPTSIAAGMSALSIYDGGKKSVIQYSVSDGRLLCRRPLDEEARRFHIWHLYSDGYQRLYLVTDQYVLQTH
jgi:proteasome lid subunit RPN8/RPN11